MADLKKDDDFLDSRVRVVLYVNYIEGEELTLTREPKKRHFFRLTPIHTC